MEFFYGRLICSNPFPAQTATCECPCDVARLEDMCNECKEEYNADLDNEELSRPS